MLLNGTGDRQNYVLSVIDERMSVFTSRMILMGKSGIFGEKSAPEPLCHTQIPHGLACGFKLRAPRRWNDTDGKTARLEKDLSRCHFVARKFHVDCTGIKPRPPYRGVVEYPRELSCGHMTRLYYFSIEGYSLFFILNVQKLPT